MSAPEAADAAEESTGPEPDSGAEPTPMIARIVGGNPTPEEAAAALAAVSEAYTVEIAAAVAAKTARPSAWQVTARGMREPLRPELGWAHQD